MSASRVRLQLAVVFGGASTEHEISVRSARAVLAALDRDRYEPIPLGVTPEGVWLSPPETALLLDTIEAGAPERVAGLEEHGPRIRPQIMEALAGADAVFPLIHGRGGEDGSVQGLLELTGLPYVGAGVAASATGMDKELTKVVLLRAGLPVPAYCRVTEHAWRADPGRVLRQLAHLPCPLFVKPANGGSSVGTSKVRSQDAIAAAIDEALRHDGKALVEQAISGREIECGVLGNAAPRASALGEIRYRREFYDYIAKYDDPSTELIVPADILARVGQRMTEMACAAFQAIGCAGMARVDFFLEEGPGSNDGIWLSEINTIPGFTSVSMFPRVWEAAGLSFRALIDQLVQLAQERHEEGR